MTLKSGLWGLVGFLALATVLVAVAHLPGVRGYLSVEGINAWVETLGYWGPVGILVVSLVLPFLFLPRWPVVFVAGALYGILWGTVIGTVAGALGAILHFMLSRRLVHTIGERARRRFKLPEHMGDYQAGILIFTLRAFPLSSYPLTNLLAGALGMKVGPFALATVAGMIPSTLMYAAWGKLMQKPSPGYYVLSVMLVAVLFLGAWLAGRKILTPDPERSETLEHDPTGR
jgi:uncharacterized membrane protein YdjX (TVP38/TMEM64 family)